jgi:hypothetical protein
VHAKRLPELSPNKPANTDPQQHKAASPLMLVVRLPLRYAAGAKVARRNHRSRSAAASFSIALS